MDLQEIENWGTEVDGLMQRLSWAFMTCSPIATIHSNFILVLRNNPLELASCVPWKLHIIYTVLEKHFFGIFLGATISGMGTYLHVIRALVHIYIYTLFKVAVFNATPMTQTKKHQSEVASSQTSDNGFRNNIIVIPWKPKKHCNGKSMKNLCL